MRILLTSDPFIPVPPKTYGGIERIVDSLVRALTHRGYEVGLVAHQDSEVEVSSSYPWPTLGLTRLDHLRNLKSLKSAHDQFRPDVVHSFSRLAYLAPLLFGRTPLIMSYQRAISATNTRIARLLSRPPIVFTACSQALSRTGSSSGGEWHGIPNFIEPDRFEFSPTVASDAPLLFLSRLDRVKGADRAIRLAKRAGVPLVIAGNRAEGGSERAYFDQEIAPFLDDISVKWIGPVDDRQKNYWLGRARAMIVPIRWEEPFGIVFAEALACGTPVISTPRGALPEIVDHGVHGFLSEDDDMLVAGIQSAHTLDRRKCRARVMERFSVESVVPQYEALYTRIRNRASTGHRS